MLSTRNSALVLAALVGLSGCTVYCSPPPPEGPRPPHMAPDAPPPPLRPAYMDDAPDAPPPPPVKPGRLYHR